MSEARSIRTSPSGEARRRLATEWLRGLPAGSPVLVLAPTRGAADDFARAALEAGEGRFGLVRMTLRQLAAELSVARLAAAGRAPVSRLGSEAMTARAVAVEREREELAYFGPVADYPGFPRALARTISEVRSAEIDWSRLAGSGASGNDVARLLRSYEEAMQTWRLADDAELLRLARGTAAERAYPYRAHHLLLLDLTPESALERDLIAELARGAPGTMAVALDGDEEGVTRLAEALDVEPERVEAVAVSSRLARLRREVFRESGEADPGPGDESVEFLSEPGEGRECVAIVRRVHELAAAGTPFDRMAVLLRDPEGYLPLLEEALRRAGVPAYFTRGTVRPDPAGRAFLSLLACAGEGLAASRFAEYLSLGQAPAPDAEGAPRLVEVPWVEPDGAQLVFKTLVEAEEGHPPEEHPAPEEESADAPVLAGTLQTPRRWEQLIVDAAVVGGRDRWQRRLAGLRAEIEKKIAALEDRDEVYRRVLEEQRRGLYNLERFALPVIDRLAGLPRQATWGEWLAALRALAGMTLRDPDRVLSVLAELEPMDRVGPVGLAEVQRTLEERLSFLRVEPPPHRQGRLFVASIDEARGRAFDVVFLPGLAEGLFPRRAAEDPLLLDQIRETLSDALDTQDDRYARERLLLRVAAGAAVRHLVVSYPTVDAMQGRARVPSFYALDVLRAADGRLPDLETLRGYTREASRSRLGWPAPQRAALAIDPAEFDVAYLQPYLTRHGSADARGRARFLLETNAWLARSLRTRWLRWQDRVGPADGIVAPAEPTLEVLARHRLTQRSYSPTALQQFAACPYRFLLYAIHRLRPREEVAPLERIDPLTRGSLFHEVQYLLFVRLRDAELLPVTAANRDAAVRLGDELLDETAGRYEEELAPAIARVWQDEIEGIRTDLRGWLHAVADSDGRWVPTYFEYSFGLGQQTGRDPLGHRDEAVFDGYRLRGSIDLVEHDPVRDVWRVTDHKTGKAPRERYLSVGAGEVLQPLVYALAAEYHLGATVETGRLFYCTRRGEFESREVPLNGENRDKIRRVLGAVDEAVSEGFLPAAPRERACEWCDYRIVCGPYEEVRTGRKKHPMLADLQKIRRLP